MMDELLWLWWVPLILVGLFVLPFMVGPILVYFTMRLSADPEVVEFDPEEPSLPIEIADHFDEVADRLEPPGFEVITAMALPRQTPGVTVVLQLMLHRQNKDAAIACAIYAKTDMGIKLQTLYTEIVARYEDGTRICANNSDALSAFSYPDHYVMYQFTMVKNPAKLYRLFQRLLERHTPSGRKILRLESERHDSIADYLAQGLLEEMDTQIESGFLYLDESRAAYRPTMKGALLMTWKNLPPLNSIAKARRDHAARRILDELKRERA